METRREIEFRRISYGDVEINECRRVVPKMVRPAKIDAQLGGIR